MQVDPIKPTLKAPGSKRLKLEHEKLLSNFAFNFNLRRYTEGIPDKQIKMLSEDVPCAEVGRCRLTL